MHQNVYAPKHVIGQGLIGGSDPHDKITKNIYSFLKGSLNVAPDQCDQIT
jgi:hypothetical protein